ncbi:hypothetical protein [Kozakia baliensis]|uniref:hypothetical protein n=1 Tax=Kozakia baliensis TaxID=153496 RepID=UPI00126961AA|nr:hypothetical protein [Kozakia baliensis]
MTIIGALIALAWLYFWVRGELWAALCVPAAWAVMLWMSFTDGGATANTPQIYAIAILLSLAAFIPHAIRYFRERRIDRTLHGVTFLSRVD